jgi:predicted ATPase
MLTRLKVNGFKNLRDVDVSFGPFTCVAGPNGAGKSNLFDAIALLGAFAAKPILDALLTVRGTNGRIAEISKLFGQPLPDGSATMEFVADLVVARMVRDDFDREESPAATFLEYSLTLRYDPNRVGAEKEPIFVSKEELRAKSSSDALRWLPFHPSKAWLRDHVIGPGRRTTPFIQTEHVTDSSGPSIKLHGEGVGGRPSSVPAWKTPQTVVCGVNAVTHPTALAARNEMRAWRMLQLEPSALRRPDELHGNPRISAMGEHLPSALMRIGGNAEIAHRLSELVPGVISVDVETDSVRQTRTLAVTLKDRVAYSASSLSDGTLRFLALAILASDPEATGLICMEEPENGIHPKRIPAMLALVRALAGEEASEEGGGDETDAPEGLRQVLINTHSPLLVAKLPDGALLVAQTLRFKGSEFVNFRPLPETWRAKSGKLRRSECVSRGELVAALGPLDSRHRESAPSKSRLVEDHYYAPDLFSQP